MKAEGTPCVGVKKISDDTMSPRFGHTLTLVNKNKGQAKAVLFGGAVGQNNHFSITNETFLFFIDTNKWLKLNRKNIILF